MIVEILKLFTTKSWFLKTVKLFVIKLTLILFFYNNNSYESSLKCGVSNFFIVYKEKVAFFFSKQMQTRSILKIFTQKVQEQEV